MSDLKKEVDKFNLVVGKHPMGGLTNERHVITKQILDQASLVKEEGMEVYLAALILYPHNFNIDEVLKECVDVWVVLSYLETLLEACGVDVEGAKKAVCDNNNTKFTKDPTEANETHRYHYNMGVDCVVESSTVDGDVYFFVKRTHDNKVLKPKDYKSVDLSEFVPKEWK